MAGPQGQIATMDVMDRGETAARVEQRRSPRVAVPLSGRWMAEGRWVHMMVETISAHGAAITTLAPLPSDSRGRLVLEGFPLAIPGEVRWANGTMAGLAFHLDSTEAAHLSDYIARQARLSSIPLPLPPEPNLGPNL